MTRHLQIVEDRRLAHVGPRVRQIGDRHGQVGRRQAGGLHAARDRGDHLGVGHLAGRGLPRSLAGRRIEDLVDLDIAADFQDAER